MALRARFVDFSEKFDPDKVVTNPKDYQYEQFTEDGIFSERIFGNYNSKEMTKGWIDFGDYYVIQPILFPYLKKAIPNLTKLIQVEDKLDKEGKKYTLHPDSIGLVEFHNNFDYYLDKYGNKEAPEYEFILKWKDVLFTNKFPILPSKIRPCVVIKSTVTGSKVNKIYKLLIQYSNFLKETDPDIEGDINVNKLTWKLQSQISVLAKTIEMEFIRRKKGWIRNNLIANRINYSARNIIGPLVKENMRIDDMSIPYKTYLELYKKQLVNLIARSKGINLIKADLIWRDATISFSPEVYKYMLELNRKTKGGQYVLFNRNPTINITSILMLRITEVKSVYDDDIIQISNNVLPGYGADYDGDVMNLYPLMNRKWVEDFAVFKPSYVVIDADNGGFNREFGLEKEQKIAYYILNNMGM